ncbi:AT hook domain-containing protein family protein, partial [Thozetella sp. PMI_491]
IEATLVFGQEEAGTAVCISPKGILLTCAHCVAETADDLDHGKLHWLVFTSGRVVAAKYAAWDDRRDLALLRIVSAQAAPVSAPGDLLLSTAGFPHVVPAQSQVPLDARLVCIGHPGSEDLEAAEAGVKTNYDVLHLSTGTFRGYSPGQDLQDNSEIGALQHDCWTYWGHSGAPLLGRKDGRLVGLHSSWDDQTAMRRGVPLEAIKEFLKEHENLL